MITSAPTFVLGTCNNQNSCFIQGFFYANDDKISIYIIFALQIPDLYVYVCVCLVFGF